MNAQSVAQRFAPSLRMVTQTGDFADFEYFRTNCILILMLWHHLVLWPVA